MLGQVRYYIGRNIVQRYYAWLGQVPESEGLYSTWNSGTKILMLNVLVPESEGLYSPWNSGTKILILSVLVPESEGLYSTWNSGTKILMLHTYILSSMFIPNLTQLMEGQVRFYRYSLLYSSIPYLTYPNLWQGRLYFTSMVIPNLALLMVGQVRLDIRI